MLIRLNEYKREWDRNVNVSKTKIVEIGCGKYQTLKAGHAMNKN